MKSRTMVYLDPEQLQILKAEARAQRISLTELIRRLIKQHIEECQELPAVPREAYLRIVALGSSSCQDISDRHDTYLGEAIHREHAG